MSRMETIPRSSETLKATMARVRAENGNTSFVEEAEIVPEAAASTIDSVSLAEQALPTNREIPVVTNDRDTIDFNNSAELEEYTNYSLKQKEALKAHRTLFRTGELTKVSKEGIIAINTFNLRFYQWQQALRRVQNLYELASRDASSDYSLVIDKQAAILNRQYEKMQDLNDVVNQCVKAKNTELTSGTAEAKNAIADTPQVTPKGNEETSEARAQTDAPYSKKFSVGLPESEGIALTEIHRYEKSVAELAEQALVLEKIPSTRPSEVHNVLPLVAVFKKLVEQYYAQDSDGAHRDDAVTLERIASAYRNVEQSFNEVKEASVDVATMLATAQEYQNKLRYLERMPGAYEYVGQLRTALESFRNFYARFVKAEEGEAKNELAQLLQQAYKNVALTYNRANESIIKPVGSKKFAEPLVLRPDMEVNASIDAGDEALAKIMAAPAADQLVDEHENNVALDLKDAASVVAKVGSEINSVKGVELNGGQLNVVNEPALAQAPSLELDESAITKNAEAHELEGQIFQSYTRYKEQHFKDYYIQPKVVFDPKIAPPPSALELKPGVKPPKLMDLAEFRVQYMKEQEREVSIGSGLRLILGNLRRNKSLRAAIVSAMSFLATDATTLKVPTTIDNGGTTTIEGDVKNSTSSIAPELVLPSRWATDPRLNILPETAKQQVGEPIIPISPVMPIIDTADQPLFGLASSKISFEQRPGAEYNLETYFTNLVKDVALDLPEEVRASALRNVLDEMYGNPTLVRTMGIESGNPSEVQAGAKITYKPLLQLYEEKIKAARAAFVDGFAPSLTPQKTFGTTIEGGGVDITKAISTGSETIIDSTLVTTPATEYLGGETAFLADYTALCASCNIDTTRSRFDSWFQSGPDNRPILAMTVREITEIMQGTDAEIAAEAKVRGVTVEALRLTYDRLVTWRTAGVLPGDFNNPMSIADALKTGLRADAKSKVVA